MPFDTKKTLESWKKAKPLLLNDTGVSGVLRSLPSDPKPDQLGEFDKALKKLDGFMADKAIKVEKKAVACLGQIKKDIDTYVAGQMRVRTLVIRDMDKVLSALKVVYRDADKVPVTSQTLRTGRVNLITTRRGLNLDPRGVDNAAVPHAVLGDWLSCTDLIDNTVEQMVKLMEDVESPKSRRDAKKEMPPLLASFKKYWGLMDKAAASVKRL